MKIKILQFLVGIIIPVFFFGTLQILADFYDIDVFVSQKQPIQGEYKSIDEVIEKAKLSDVPGLAFEQKLQAVRNRIEYEERRNRAKAAQEEEHKFLRTLIIIFASLFIGMFLSIWCIKKFFTTTKPILKEYGDDEVIDAEFVENDDRKH